MSNTVFGLTMLTLGMGGTLVTLFILTLIIRLICVLFPVARVEKAETK